MIPKVVPAISIFWVVGVYGATGPTQLHPSSGREATAPTVASTVPEHEVLLLGTSLGPASPSGAIAPVLGSGARTGSHQPGLHSGPPTTGTPPKPQTMATNSSATSNVAVNSTSRPAAARVPLQNPPLSSTSSTSTPKPSVPQNQASTGAKPIAQQTAGSTSTSVRNTQASGPTTSVSAVQNGQPGGGLPPVPPAAGERDRRASGTRNKEPKEPGITAAQAPSVTTRPVVQKPGSQPPKPLNENVAQNRPRTQGIVSQTFSEGPLNDIRLVKPTPRRRNQGIYLYVDEKDIPFFPGPLNEPPLSVFVYRMHPELPRRLPRLPSILRMRPAEQND